jgi:hypothetical protein
MIDDREAFLRIRLELREPENAAYRARMACDAARRRMEDSKTRLGEHRLRAILVSGQ